MTVNDVKRRDVRGTISPADLAARMLVPFDQQRSKLAPCTGWVCFSSVSDAPIALGGVIVSRL